MAIGAMLRQWLVKLEWFSTLFPRIPVPIQQKINSVLQDKFPPTPTVPHPIPTETKSRDWGRSWDRETRDYDRERDYERDRDHKRDRDRRERDRSPYRERERERSPYRERHHRSSRDDRDQRSSKKYRDERDRYRR